MPADKHDERHKMMITNSKEENSPQKLATTASSSSSSAAAAASTTTPWLRLKDPRIVRVSRAFGGKDRHSKVCTIRGLRDRRVRLSVSTAIQLYDLQDRLGLNQPSKVVDWLLNAAKDEIDELPPLPIPSASLGLHYQSMLQPHTTLTHPNRSEFKIINCNNIDIDDKAEDAAEQKSNSNPSQGSSSFSALLNNVATTAIPPFGLYHHHWEPSSSSSSSTTTTTNNLPIFFTSQAEDLHLHHHHHNFNSNNVNLSLPVPLSLSTGSQFLEFNHHQNLHQNFLLNNSLVPPPPNNLHHPEIRPFHFSMAPKFFSQEKNNNNNANLANKDDDGFGSDHEG